MDEILASFLVETREIFEQLDNKLIALEKNPDSPETLSAIFRAVHTIKGNCPFLGFPKLEQVSHAGESLLAKLRQGDCLMNSAIADALLSMVDSMREIMGCIESTGKDDSGDYSALIANLNGLCAGDAGPAKPAAAPHAPAPASEARAPAAADSTVRVDIRLLDKLMNQVGELVLTRNQFLQAAVGREETPFFPITQRLDTITAELQANALQTRMQPVEIFWNSFPRVVRDLAQTCGKQVRLEMEGGGTELDRTVIEAIKDPLTHIIRNAVDHGIEAPDKRLAKGKPAEGRLRLRAYHEGGQVRIEISDDGGGLDVDKIRNRAVANGLTTPEKAARMSKMEVLDLLFLPGFSTAEKVTTISGRGVGMDVVKAHIEKIGGHVELDSTLGQGTTIKIQIPLTLAIIPAFIVACRGQRYAISRKDILELVRLRGDGEHNEVERLHDTPVCRLRGRLLPLVYLHHELGLGGDSSPERDGGAVNIVVLQAGESRLGLVVDEVLSADEIVVRSLGRYIEDISVFSGSTIMGDGRVVLILDAMGLARKSRISSSETASVVFGAENSEAKPAAATTQLVLTNAADDGRMAIDLSTVERLEYFERDAVERVGDLDVVKYCGGILPLVTVSNVLVERRQRERSVHFRTSGEGQLHVAVCLCRGQKIGIVVHQILDILDDAMAVRRPASREGVFFSAVVREKVTEILDVEKIVQMADASLLAPPAGGGDGE